MDVWWWDNQQDLNLSPSVSLFGSDPHYARRLFTFKSEPLAETFSALYSFAHRRLNSGVCMKNEKESWTDSVLWGLEPILHRRSRSWCQLGVGALSLIRTCVHRTNWSDEGVFVAPEIAVMPSNWMTLSQTHRHKQGSRFNFSILDKQG